MNDLYSYHVERHARAVLHATEEGVFQTAWERRVQDHAQWAKICKNNLRCTKQDTSREHGQGV